MRRDALDPSQAGGAEPGDGGHRVEGARKAYDALPRHKQLFVDMLTSGGTLEEAAKAAGSRATSSATLKTTAMRWRDEPEVQAALVEMQTAYAVPGTEEFSLREEAIAALKKVLKGTNDGAIVRGVELVLKLSGDLKRKDVRNAHLHLHVGKSDSLSPAEESRMLAIALRGRTVRCPGCGAEVPLGGAES